MRRTVEDNDDDGDACHLQSRENTQTRAKKRKRTLRAKQLIENRFLPFVSFFLVEHKTRHLKLTRSLDFDLE